MPNQIKVNVDAKETGLDKIEKDARAAGKAVGDSLQKGMGEAESAGTRASKQIKDDLGKVEKAGRDTGERLTESFNSAFEGIGNAVGGSAGELVGSLGKGLTAGKAGLLGAGAAVGGFIMEGVEKATEQRRIGGMIAAQTGQATDAAGRLGEMAGDIYAENFGESIDQVGEAITSLFQNEVIDTSAPEQAVEDLTKKVLTLSQTTGESVEKVTRSAQQLVLTGLAGSFGQAMDMIQKATEDGLNVSGELLDTIDEYSVQFQRMGLSGAEAFGLLEQATDAGARNIDVVADAIKEFDILAQDSTSSAARGFRTLGMDVGQSMAAVAAGGAPAKEVLREVLNRLQELPPSVQRSTAAVDLFGTKAEDLGNSLYAMDVDTVTESFGKFDGAVEKASKTVNDTTPALDKLGRSVGNAAAWVGGYFVDAADTMVQGLGEMTGLIDDTADSSDDASGSTKEWGSELWHTNEATATLIQTMDELISQQSKYANTFVDSAEAQIDYNKALADAEKLADNFADGLNDTKTGFDLTSEAGQNAQGIIDNLVTSGWNMVEALSADGASAEQLNGVITDSNTKLYELLVSMGVNSDAARVLADRMFGIPDVDPTVTLVDNASPKIADITRKLNDLDGTWINTYVNTIFKTTGKPPADSPAGGAGLLGSATHAHGGIASAAELGAVYASGFPFAAAGGAQGMATIIKDEQGPEIARLPNGSIIVPHGQSEAIMAGMGGGGTQVVLSMESSDPLIRAVMQAIRVEVKDNFGGSVTNAFNQRGVR